MRHTPEAIQNFLTTQIESGQSVANFCADKDIKIPTFYSWKRKYKEIETIASGGFCKITPRREMADRSLRLPSGLQLELVGLTISEIAELILEIDRAHA